MPTTITGTVTNGVVVPHVPLPEGAQVEIRLHESLEEIPLELQQELAAWQLGSAEALALVERLAKQEEANEKR